MECMTLQLLLRSYLRKDFRTTDRCTIITPFKTSHLHPYSILRPFHSQLVDFRGGVLNRAMMICIYISYSQDSDI